MIYKIGSAEQIKDLAAIATLPLAAGDIVEVQPGTYTKFPKLLPRVGTQDNPITIKSSVKHSAILDGQDFNFAFTPRAAFEVTDGSYVFDGFKAKNISNGGLNASAFRAIKGDLLVKNCHLRNCSMGVMTTAARLVILEGNDIGWCGFGNNSHNIYLSGGTDSIIEHNTFRQTAGGINVKVRTRNSIVRNNKIYESLDGELQFCDGPETLIAGADALVEDNEFLTLANRGRGNKQRVIAFGHEGHVGTDRIGTLRLFRNKITLLNKDQICVSLDSLNAGFEARDNFIEGISNNLLRIRYGTHAGLVAPLNYMRGLAFKDWPLLYIVPAPPAPPDTIPPAAPQNLRASQTPTPGHIVLEWDPVADDIDYYEIGEQFGPYSSGDECKFTSMATGVIGRIYTFTVTAVDKAGNRGVTSVPLSVVKS